MAFKTKIDSSIIRAISTVLNPTTVLIESTPETRKRTENVLHHIQTLDEDDAKQVIFDQRQLNGSRQQFDLYFKLCNMYLKHIEGLTSVNARRHTNTLYLSSNWYVRGFMESVIEYIKQHRPNDLDHIKVPSGVTVMNAFYPPIHMLAQMCVRNGLMLLEY